MCIRDRITGSKSSSPKAGKYAPSGTCIDWRYFWFRDWGHLKAERAKATLGALQRPAGRPQTCQGPAA
eukprot:7587749-Alexandrium_andersonii.AAC.1